jgi:pyrroloquinoline quinone biosynthesis protein E
LTIDYVVPDYYGVRPKSCMAAGAVFLNVHFRKACPAMPPSLPGPAPSIRESNLAEIWYRSDAFNRFRGTDWMAEPCRSCGGADRLGRLPCQAFLLAGDAGRADPVCAVARARRDRGRRQQAENVPDAFVYRHFS